MLVTCSAGELPGTVVAVLVQPWGTDVIVQLDEPQCVGNTDFGPVEWLSVSSCSLKEIE